MNNAELKSIELTSLEKIRKQISSCQVLVVSCGPSISQWEYEYKKLLRNGDVFVICVKQSYLEIKSLCNMHVINQVNLQKYKYHPQQESSPFVVFGMGNFDSRDFSFIKRNFTFNASSSGNLSDSLCGMASNYENFNNKFSFSKNPLWGPGIMHEFVLPFLVHAKPLSVTTVGWDIADKVGNNSHFYSHKAPSSIKKKLNILKTTLSNLMHKNKLLLKIHDNYRNIIIRYRYHALKKINQYGMMEGEAEIVSNSMECLKKLFNEKKIKLNIVSTSRWT